MGKRVLCLAPTGFGKSHALQYLEPTETFIVNADKESLPWRGSESQYKEVMIQDPKNPRYGKISFKNSNMFMTDKMSEIGEALDMININRPDIKVFVIDTLTTAMVASVMANFRIDDWNKFAMYAEEFYSLIKKMKSAREDLFIWVNAHVEVADFANERKMLQFQIPGGKFTREKLTPEKSFNVVLHGDVRMVEGEPIYYFNTRTNGNNTAKAPEGLFPATIANNAKMVIERVEAYHRGDNLPPMESIVSGGGF